MNALTRSLALFYMLIWNSKRPNRDLFIHAMAMSLLSFLIPMAPVLGSGAFLLLLVSFLLSGFSRGYSFMPSFIFNQHFDGADKDKETARVWMGLAEMFNMVAMFCFGFLMYSWHWSW